MLVVGITGGIGSGKTEVCDFFSNHGAQVLSADLIAKNIMDTNSTIKNKIKRSFGNQIIQADGVVNKKRLAALVFTNPSLKKDLNKIVHPSVLDYLSKKIRTFKKSGKSKLLVIEAALIYEAKVENMFDYIVVVDAPIRLRTMRIMKRDNVNRTEVLNRMRAQIDTSQKVKQGDIVIYNIGDFSSLRMSCQFVYHLLCKISNQG